MNNNNEFSWKPIVDVDALIRFCEQCGLTDTELLLILGFA